jgi:hypothetical protein
MSIYCEANPQGILRASDPCKYLIPTSLVSIFLQLLSLPIIGFGIYLAVADAPQCFRWFMYPVLILGGLILFL